MEKSYKMQQNIFLTFRSLCGETITIHKIECSDNKWRQANNALQAPNNLAFGDGGTK